MGPAVSEKPCIYARNDVRAYYYRAKTKKHIPIRLFFLTRT